MSKQNPKPNCRYKADKNCFECRIVHDGKRVSATGRTEKEAIQKANDKIKLLEDGMNLDNQRITLETFYELWLEEQKQVVKPSTIYSYEKSWKYIKKQLGYMRISEIEKAHVIKFRKTMLNGKKSETTVNNATRLLRQILNAAVNDRIINFNPCNGVKKLKTMKPKAAETNHRALTEDETKQFLKLAADSHYYLLFRFLLNTGVRIGEALALTWFDVNTAKKEIHIRKTVSRTSDKGFELMETPKTSTSKRTIPITEEINKILQEQKKRNSYLFSHCEWIFPNTRGGMGNYNNVDICIKQIVKNINEQNDGSRFDHFSVHAFRDTFATRCIEQGMNPQTLKVLLGHSNLKMTMDLYAHVMPNTKAEELEKIVIAI